MGGDDKGKEGKPDHVEEENVSSDRLKGEDGDRLSEQARQRPRRSGTGGRQGLVNSDHSFHRSMSMMPNLAA